MFAELKESDQISNEPLNKTQRLKSWRRMRKKTKGQEGRSSTTKIGRKDKYINNKFLPCSQTSSKEH
jgi:hypothetical protein